MPNCCHPSINTKTTTTLTHCAIPCTFVSIYIAAIDRNRRTCR